MRFHGRFLVGALASVVIVSACGGGDGADSVATNEGETTGTSAGAGGASGGSASGGSSSGGKAGASGGKGGTAGGAGTGVVSTGGGGGSAGGGGASGGSAGKGGASAGGAGASGIGGQCQIGGQGGSAGGTSTKCGAKEICGNGFDDDCNGFIDEGCPCSPGKTQPCYAHDPAEIGKASCKAGVQTCEGNAEFNGWSACVGAVYGSPEVCDGKTDENCNGAVDENCGCCPGTTEACGSSVGACKPGKRTCQPNGTFGPCEGEVKPLPQETCDNKVDDNCNGIVDEGCTIEVTININGDCVCSAPCPPQAPYPVGCKIDFQGGDPNGCVALAKNQVYFQEGDACGAGNVSGTLKCSSQKGAGLNATNCPINKSKPKYGAKPSDCVATSGTPGSCYYLIANRAIARSSTSSCLAKHSRARWVTGARS